MIQSLQFKNFRILRDATLLLGPNGSGKSTVLFALEALRNRRQHCFEEVVSLGAANAAQQVQVSARVGRYHIRMLVGARPTGDLDR
jgi:ABC-type cobalamin/Fe3+-siderophores transport system ATPase subunit